MAPNDPDALQWLIQNVAPGKLEYPLVGGKSFGPMLFEEYEAEREALSAKPQSKPAGKPGILTLTIECQWGPTMAEPCERVIEVRGDMTLLGLHDVIQQAVKFDDDHCFEFFIGRHERDRKIIFGESGEGRFDGALEKVQLFKIWPLPKGTFLFYWFDFGDDWKFRIRKAKAGKPPAKGVKYPRLIKKVGPNPVQYPDFE